jgi:hypothetical protein
MVLSVHSSAAFQTDSGWPSFWPPVQLPPPSPLSAAASSLWSPKLGGGPTTAQVLEPLYSAQLSQGGQGGAAAGFQMAFLDKRIALMRFDASHAQEEANVAA